MRRLVILCAVVLLAGCQLALPGAGAKTDAAPAANAITGGAIEVTSLDAPKAASEAVRLDAAKPVDASLETLEAPEILVEPAEAVVVEIKTPMHLACEKTGGRWSRAGTANSSFCQTPTDQGAKQCTKRADCKGACLAKSRSCSPYTPLLGCNDILDDQGRVQTECIN